MLNRITGLGCVAALLLAAAGCDSLGDDGNAPPGGGPDDPILPVYYDQPAWHPDGTWIATTHGDSLDTDGDGAPDTTFGGIWLVQARTAEKQPLIRGFDAPDWSADGRTLAMERSGQIYTVTVESLNPARIDSSSLRKITTGGRFFAPAWGPDGNRIAYRNTIGDTIGVWISSHNRSEKRKYFAYGGTPDWFPGQEALLYPSDGLWIETLDHASKTQIYMDSTHTMGDPTISPDGSKIAFFSEVQSGPTSLFTINADGTHKRRISPPYSYRLAWSPDGEQIVFVRWGVSGCEPPFEGSGHLWLAQTDGSGVRQLTTRPDLPADYGTNYPQCQ